MDKNYFVLEKRKGYWHYYIYRYGKRIYRSTGEKTRTKALEVIYARIQADDLLNENKKKVSTLFSEYSKPFFIYDICPIVQDKIQRGGHYSVAGCKNNRLYVEKYLNKEFGHMSLEEITVSKVNTFLRSMPKKHNIAPQTANKVLGVLRQILDQAVSESILHDNPARKVRPLIAKKSERGCFTVEEIHKILNSDWNDKYMELIIKLAATTGMRMGEIRGLCWEQIKEDYILVDRSWAKGEGLKSTKSGNDRIVPILPDLRQQILNLPVLCDFVFSYNGTNPISKETIADRLTAKLESLNIDYKAENLTFHSFRHFFNTRLVACGVRGEEIRAVIGHESESMTAHYLHLSTTDMKQIREIQMQIDA